MALTRAQRERAARKDRDHEQLCYSMAHAPEFKCGTCKSSCMMGVILHKVTRAPQGRIWYCRKCQVAIKHMNDGRMHRSADYELGRARNNWRPIDGNSIQGTGT